MLSIGEGELALVISVQLFHDHAAGTEHAPWQWHMHTIDQWNYATTRDTHAPWQWHMRTTDQWNYATTRDTYKSPKQVNTVQFSVINTTYFCQAEYH